MTQFDVSSIPAGSTVTSATLQYYVTQREMINRNSNIQLYSLSQAWTENGVTRLYSDINALQSWTDGGSLGSLLCTTNFPAGTGWLTFDVPASTIQAWIDGSTTNNGLIIKSNNDYKSSPTIRKDFLCIASSEYATANLRPKLEIIFTPSGNVLPQVCLTVNEEDVVTPGVDAVLTADAVDTDGSVTNVEFYVDGKLAGSDPNAPYSCIWTNPVIGNRNIYAKAYDNSGGAISSVTKVVTVGTVLYSADMDSNPAGWTLEPEWEYGVPSGVDEASMDGYGEPSSGFTGTNIIGYQLDYPYYYGTLTEQKYATTPAIDCTQHDNVTLRFRCWLGMWYTRYGHSAGIEVSTNGSTWQAVWASEYTHPGGTWPLWEVDISSIADNNSSVYIRWEIKGGSQYASTYTYSGWNLDDVVVIGEPIVFPEMDVYGNGVEISDGDMMPSTGDGTDFGVDVTGGGSVSHMFAITNSGIETLNLSGLPKVYGDTNDFTVISHLGDGVIAPGASAAFEVEFDPTVLGVRNAEISILSDDTDESPYSFAIQGARLDTPSVNISAATDVSGFSAQVNGILNDCGHADVYVYWGTTDGGTDPAQWSNTGLLSQVSEEVFSYSVEGLDMSTTYYYNFCATNIAGSDWAASDSFTTTLMDFKVQRGSFT
ncbi:choice-of-anchor D domain-containing protein, partial [Verrucomicrobiota bacterium]